MAKGGARKGAGRPKGAAMLKLHELMKKKDIDQFVEWLLTSYMDDSRVAIWMADHLFGKAPQPITGPDGGPVQVTGVEINVRK